MIRETAWPPASGFGQEAGDITSHSFFFSLFSERIYFTRAWISSSFNLSANGGIGVPFLPVLIVSTIFSSVMPCCHFGSVKSGVLMAAYPLPSAPWHIEHFCLKMVAASGSSAARRPLASSNADAVTRNNLEKSPVGDLISLLNSPKFDVRAGLSAWSSVWCSAYV